MSVQSTKGKAWPRAEGSMFASLLNRLRTQQLLVWPFARSRTGEADGGGAIARGGRWITILILKTKNGLVRCAWGWSTVSVTLYSRESQTLLRQRLLPPGGRARTEPVWASVLPGGNIYIYILFVIFHFYMVINSKKILCQYLKCFYCCVLSVGDAVQFDNSTR